MAGFGSPFLRKIRLDSPFIIYQKNLINLKKSSLFKQIFAKLAEKLF
jgi:hypothetical protein